MTTTPSNRLKLTPSNSPFLSHGPYRSSARSPVRGGRGSFSTAGGGGVGGNIIPPFESRLSLQRVIGTTCASPTGFDAAGDSFAYIAGGAVVVVDVEDARPATPAEGEGEAGDLKGLRKAGRQHQEQQARKQYSQRFFRARPTAVPVYATSLVPMGGGGSSSGGGGGAGGGSGYTTPTSTPKANDSRNRVSLVLRDSPYGGSSGNANGSGYDWSTGESPSSGKTWTSRERIKAATCLALSRCGRFLAVGETGYAPRVLVFGLSSAGGGAGAGSDTPLVAIGEHTFGVRAVAWSADSRFLASLGAQTDGFLYLWRIDPRTGAARLFQQNRCTANIRGMVWLGSAGLITFGVRHVKLWRVEEAGAGVGLGAGWAGNTGGQGLGGGGSGVSPIKQRFQNELGGQKTLPGRNILLGTLLEATFSAAALVAEGKVVLCSESGDVCLLDEPSRADGAQQQRAMKLTKVLDLGFPVSCVTVRDRTLHVGGRAGQFVRLDADRLAQGRRDCVLGATRAATGLLALGFLSDRLVTVDAKRHIDVRPPDYVPGDDDDDKPEAEADAAQADGHHRIRIPGHGDAVVGIQLLEGPNKADADFFTWSGPGKVILWDLEGRIKATFDVPLELCGPGLDADLVNQLTVVRATREGKLFIAADKLGVMRVVDAQTKRTVFETKAHSTDCHSIAVYEDDSRLMFATCGRDRTAQLFHRTSSGGFELFQTLEFAAKVVQVLITSDDRIITCSLDRTLQMHDMVSKEDEPDAVAAIQSKVLSLKGSPTSMAISRDEKTVYVSLLDRSVCVFDVSAGGRLTNTWKCTDEGGVESVVFDSLVLGQLRGRDGSFLLGISNTDKSVRIYDSQSGAFLDREWGHTEAINGAILVEGQQSQQQRQLEDSTSDSASTTSASTASTGLTAPPPRKVVSVGSDGTIMLWSLDLDAASAAAENSASSLGGRPSSRDPSPAKDAPSTAARPPLRRVLSKAELAEFQRPSTSSGGGGSTPTSALGRRSPPRPLLRRSSRYGLSSAAAASTPGGTSTASTAGSGGPLSTTALIMRTPVSAFQPASSPSTIAEDRTPSRRASSTAPTSRSGSPPSSAGGMLSSSTSVSGGGATGATGSRAASLARRPSLPALRVASSGSVRAKSMTNLRGSLGSSTAAGTGASTASTGAGAAGAAGAGTASNASPASRDGHGFGSIGMATEQTSRALRAYRKKLTANTTDPIGREALAELDRELRLTAAALGDRAVALRTAKSAAVQDSILLEGLLDQCSERIVELVGERLQRRGLVLGAVGVGGGAVVEAATTTASPTALGPEPPTAPEKSPLAGLGFGPGLVGLGITAAIAAATTSAGSPGRVEGTALLPGSVRGKERLGSASSASGGSRLDGVEEEDDAAGAESGGGARLSKTVTA